MDPELAKLAERGRENQSLQQQVDASRHRAAQSTLQRQQRHALNRAIGAHDAALFPAMACFLAVAAAIFFIIGKARFGENIVIVLVASSVPTVAVYWWGKQRRLARTRRWLTTLPFAVDTDSYLLLMGTDHMGFATIRVQVTFASPVEESARATVANAILGAVEGRSGFEGDRLYVESPQITTRNWSTNSTATGKPTNRRLHKWFTRCINRGLKTVHTSYPIASVSVSVK